MGFELKEIDITFKPDLLISKGIRALPVVEVGKAHWIGNATSKRLADFIRSSEVSAERSSMVKLVKWGEMTVFFNL